MSEANRELIRQFFANLNSGTPDEALFTPDWVVWTLSTRSEEAGRDDLEANRVLASLFPSGLAYTVQSVMVDGDRAAARVVGQGVLHNGEEYRNDYVFLFEIRDGRIARLEEFFDTRPVEEQLMPLLMAAMGSKFS